MGSPANHPTPGSDFPRPYPVQFKGSVLARWVLRLFGWTLQFDGLPSRQGVLVFYPHTSNWDFVLAMLAKSAIGMPARFWAKDSLFRIPLFGAWLRWLGGVPVMRHSKRGTVGEVVDRMAESRQRYEFFWLALAPEGTRSRADGWRSGTRASSSVSAGFPTATRRCRGAPRPRNSSSWIRRGPEAKKSAAEHEALQR